MQYVHLKVSACMEIIKKKEPQDLGTKYILLTILYIHKWVFIKYFKFVIAFYLVMTTSKHQVGV